MSSTLKYDRKRKQEQKRKQGLEKTRERALKFYKGRGFSLGIDVSEQAELNALDAYVESLQELQEELEDKYGDIPEFRRAFRWVGSEISRALERIVKLNIQLKKPG